MKNYWLCYKNGKYINDFDINGKPILITEKDKAYRFYDFHEAVEYFHRYGFALIKENEEIPNNHLSWFDRLRKWLKF